MSASFTIRVGCVVCRALRDIDPRSLSVGWPYCHDRPMIARTLRAVRRPEAGEP